MLTATVNIRNGQEEERNRHASGSQWTLYKFKDAYTLLEDFWKEVDKRI
jgi:hypothetical protein